MFATYNNRQSLSRDLEANKFLLAHGCTIDGRKVEEVDPKQVSFDNRVAYCGRFCSDGNIERY